MKRVGISDPFSERERKTVVMEKSVFAMRLDHCYNELKVVSRVMRKFALVSGRNLLQGAA